MIKVLILVTAFVAVTSGGKIKKVKPVTNFNIEILRRYKVIPIYAYVLQSCNHESQLVDKIGQLIIEENSDSESSDESGSSSSSDKSVTSSSSDESNPSTSSDKSDSSISSDKSDVSSSSSDESDTSSSSSDESDTSSPSSKLDSSKSSSDSDSSSSSVLVDTADILIPKTVIT